MNNYHFRAINHADPHLVCAGFRLTEGTGDLDRKSPCRAGAHASQYYWSRAYRIILLLYSIIIAGHCTILYLVVVCAAVSDADSDLLIVEVFAVKFKKLCQQHPKILIVLSLARMVLECKSMSDAG